MVPEIQKIVSKILVLPGRPLAMLDGEVATVYETTTRRINQAMKRNLKRFPEHFYFQLTEEETKIIMEDPRFKVTDCDRIGKDAVTDCDRINATKRNKRYLPYAYTREGCNMLAMVLHTAVAIDRSIWIVEGFTEFERVGLHGIGGGHNAPIVLNAWVIHELREIYGTEGCQKILADMFGINPSGFKDRISPFEMSIIRNDNPNRLHRDQCIAELVERGVDIELIAGLSGMSKPTIYGISKSMKIVADMEARKALPTRGLHE